MDNLKILKFFLVFLFLSFYNDANAQDVVEKKLAIEAEYGSVTINPQPLNEIGSKLYGTNIYTTTTGGNIIYVFAPGLVFGLDYRNLIWNFEEPKVINGGALVTQNRVNITQTSLYFDLTPFAFGSLSKNSIAKGFFLETGPCLTQLNEEYVRSDTGKYTFSSTGYGLDVRVGFRTLTRDPLSFIARAKLTIPLGSDNKKSETGLKLDGSIITSINLGFCVSF